jgi:hypothetical protein
MVFRLGFGVRTTGEELTVGTDIFTYSATSISKRRAACGKATHLKLPLSYSTGLSFQLVDFMPLNGSLRREVEGAGVDKN